MPHSRSIFSKYVTRLPVALQVALIRACAPMTAMYSQDSVSDSIKVPNRHLVAMQTVGIGETSYECRVKKNMAGQFEWTFVGPDALLNDRHGAKVGKYYGPPASGNGAMSSVSDILRVVTVGGISPASVCDTNKAGSKQNVRSQANDIF